MASSVVIPLDIIDSIIAAIDDHDHHSLKLCALVSSSFLLPCRKRLFSSISLRSERACQRLHHFLVENPVVQVFVRSVSWDRRFRVKESHSSLISVLRLPFYCLKSFYMWGAFNWNDFSSELKYALWTIIHTSTLKTLRFKLVNMPMSLLQGIHLTKLTLWSISPLDLFDFKGNQPRLALASSEGVPNTVIDHCEWGFCLVSRDLPEPIFLPFMCHIRVFEILIYPDPTGIPDPEILSFMIRSLRVSLSSPAILEHIKVRITDWCIHSDCGALLRSLRVADVWKHLDSIMTHPSGSRLQRVDIDVRYTFRYNVGDRDETEVVEAILCDLPLLRERGILFVEATDRGMRW